MRINTLPYTNIKMQGAQRREWLRQYSPQHLQQCTTLVLHALQQRQQSASQSTLVLGAGACTEVPLAELTRASDEVVLVDLDTSAMQQGRSELSSPALRKRIRLVEGDISGGISANLARIIELQDWKALVAQDAQALFDAAARCLEQCPVPDPAEILTLGMGEFGLVISSLVLSQLFSYPILDLLDSLQRMAPKLLGEQERHRRYQEAAQAFRIRIINAHLHLLRDLTDIGGVVVLLSDIRGFVFNVLDIHSSHNAEHRRTIPLVPRIFPDLIRDTFTVVEEAQWEWLTDLPEEERPGRGYGVTGYVLKSLQ